jgi:hypothetical protein
LVLTLWINVFYSKITTCKNRTIKPIKKKYPAKFGSLNNAGMSTEPHRNTQPEQWN